MGGNGEEEGAAGVRDEKRALLLLRELHLAVQRFRVCTFRFSAAPVTCPAILEHTRSRGFLAHRHIESE